MYCFTVHHSVLLHWCLHMHMYVKLSAQWGIERSNAGTHEKHFKHRNHSRNTSLEPPSYQHQAPHQNIEMCLLRAGMVIAICNKPSPKKTSPDCSKARSPIQVTKIEYGCQSADSASDESQKMRTSLSCNAVVHTDLQPLQSGPPYYTAVIVIALIVCAYQFLPHLRRYTIKSKALNSTMASMIFTVKISLAFTLCLMSDGMAGGSLILLQVRKTSKCTVLQFLWVEFFYF